MIEFKIDSFSISYLIWYLIKLIDIFIIFFPYMIWISNKKMLDLKEL